MTTETSLFEIVEASLERVWNERDDTRRLAALAELYRRDAVLYEPDNVVTGIDAISATVARVLAELPSGFRFAIAAPPVGHHGLAVARWQGGPDGTVIVTGSDVARIEDGQIAELHVFFDPAP